MKRKTFIRAIAAAILIGGGLVAQAPNPDILGRWVGSADTTDEAGTKRQEKQTLEIKSEDGKLTGMMVNRSGKGGIPFQVQQVEGKVNLYGFLTLDGGEHLRWKFELKNGSLVGTFSAQHDNPAKWMYDRIGAMTVTRDEAPPAAPASK
jgi:hypothetical protein